MKTVKRLLNFIFLICLCCTTLIANAAGEELGMIVDGSIASLLNNAVPLQR